MMRIELIYFDGCPNAERARENVRAALEAARSEVAVREWERADPAAPSYVLGYPSPTVLVNGSDVTGEGPVAHASCRAGGAPTVAAILKAIGAS
jgi:hypothetical protein